MTKIHNAFSSEEWDILVEKILRGYIASEILIKNRTTAHPGTIVWSEEAWKVIKESWFMGNPIAAELEKKEKEVNEIIKSIVPERKTFPEYESDDFDRGYRFCIDELNKNIGE